MSCSGSDKYTKEEYCKAFKLAKKVETSYGSGGEYLKECNDLF